MNSVMFMSGVILLGLGIALPALLAYLGELAGRQRQPLRFRHEGFNFEFVVSDAAGVPTINSEISYVDLTNVAMFPHGGNAENTHKMILQNLQTFFEHRLRKASRPGN